MNREEFITFLTDYGFSNHCPECIPGLPNRHDLDFGYSGLAVIQEPSGVVYLKVVSDPEPVLIEDTAALQAHRQLWSGKKIPVYVPQEESKQDSVYHKTPGEEIPATFEEALVFISDYLLSIRGLYLRAKELLEGVKNSIDSMIKDVENSIDIRSSLLNWYEDKKPAVAPLEITFIADGECEYVFKTGLYVETIFGSGFSDETVIISFKGFPDDNSLFRIRYFLSVERMVGQYRVLRNSMFPDNIDTSKDTMLYVNEVLSLIREVIDDTHLNNIELLVDNINDTLHKSIKTIRSKPNNNEH